MSIVGTAAFVGGAYPSGTQSWNGYLDDLRVWHEELNNGSDLTALLTSSAHLYETTKAVEYDYDAFDRRIRKQIDNDGNGEFDDGGDEVQEYVYDGQNIVLALDGSGAVTNRYLHGPAVDMILADEQYGASDHDDPETDEGVVYWPLTDHLGSVRDLVDNDGDVAKHIEYDGFGQMTADHPEIEHIYGFAGSETDSESHLQYTRASYYDAAIGSLIGEQHTQAASARTRLSTNSDVYPCQISSDGTVGGGLQGPGGGSVGGSFGPGGVQGDGSVPLPGGGSLGGAFGPSGIDGGVLTPLPGGGWFSGGYGPGGVQGGGVIPLPKGGSFGGAFGPGGVNGSGVVPLPNGGSLGGSIGPNGIDGSGILPLPGGGWFGGGAGPGGMQGSGVIPLPNGGSLGGSIGPNGIEGSGILPLPGGGWFGGSAGPGGMQGSGIIPLPNGGSLGGSIGPGGVGGGAVMPLPGGGWFSGEANPNGFGVAGYSHCLAEVGLAEVTVPEACRGADYGRSPAAEPLEGALRKAVNGGFGIIKRFVFSIQNICRRSVLGY